MQLIVAPCFTNFKDTLHKVYPGSKTGSYIYWTQAAGHVPSYLNLMMLRSKQARALERESGLIKVRQEVAGTLQTLAVWTCDLSAAFATLQAGGITLCFVCWVSHEGTGTSSGSVTTVFSALPGAGTSPEEGLSKHLMTAWKRRKEFSYRQAYSLTPPAKLSYCRTSSQTVRGWQLPNRVGKQAQLTLT